LSFNKFPPISPLGFGGMWRNFKSREIGKVRKNGKKRKGDGDGGHWRKEEKERQKEEMEFFLGLLVLLILATPL